MICDGLDNRVMTIHVIRDLLHFASKSYYTLRRSYYNLHLHLRCNRHFYTSQCKIGSQVVDTGRGSRGGEIVSPVSFWVNNYIKRKLTTF